MTAIEATRRTGVFRGWWVLAGVFIVLTTGSGFAFYSQGVYLKALTDEQGFSVAAAGAGTGFFFVVSGIAGYYTGGLIGRFDVRAVMVVGATIAAAGIYGLGLVRTEWQMFVVYAVFAGGYALCGLVPATSLVTRWFHARRSVALAVASTGLSVGGIAVTPLIAQLIDGSSLVALAPELAIAYWLGVVPVTLLLVRPWPEALGLRPDGAEPVDGDDQGPAPGMPFAEAIRTRYFKLLSAGYVLIMGAQVGALQHIFNLTSEKVDVDTASLAVLVVSATSVMARLAGGVAATRISLRTLTSALVVVQTVGIVALSLAEGRVAILAGVVVFGLAIGNLLMLHPLLLAEAYGVRDYPRIYGLGSLLMILGVGLGPFVVGLIRDAAEYAIAFQVVAAVALVGLAIYRFAGRADERWADGTGIDGEPSIGGSYSSASATASSAMRSPS